MPKMPTVPENYNNIRAEIVELLKAARSAAARNVNSIMTATYWEIGRRIVEQELKGEARSNYGEQLLELLAKDLTKQFGRGLGISISGECAHFTVPGPKDRFFRHCRKNLATCFPSII